MSSNTTGSRNPLARRHVAPALHGQFPLPPEIAFDPGICHGKPCGRGLRHPVEFLLELLSGGMTSEQVLANYSDLEADDLRAVYAYGARLSRVQRIEPLAV